jgi:hypothetical protein
MIDVSQIVTERLEHLQQIAEDEKLSPSERYEAVFEIVSIKKAANSIDKNKFKELLKNIFVLVDGM